MSEKFDDVLNDCLERLAEGEDIQQCIERYPEHEDELVPLLRIARVTMQVAAASYRPEAKARGLVRIHQAIAARREPSRWRLALDFWRPAARPLSVGFAAAFLTLVAAGGTTMASSNSVPGDPLYRVKTLREQISLSMTRSDGDRAKVHARLARKRGEEIRRLIVQDKYNEAQQLMTRMRHHLGQSGTLIGVTLATDPIDMPIRSRDIHRVPNAITLKYILERDGIVMSVQMSVLLREVPPHQRRRIRRILHESNLGYRTLIVALDDNDAPFFRSTPFIVPVR